jgi:YD repeat-containing protein
MKASRHSEGHGAVIRVYDEAGNVIETHDYTGDFKEW